MPETGQHGPGHGRAGETDFDQMVGGPPAGGHS